MPEIVYTKAQTDTLLSPKVPTSRTVAGKPLTADVTISKGDVGLGVVDNVAAAALRDRTTHTGTQAQSTVSGLTTALAAKVAGLGGVKAVKYAAVLPAWTPADEGTLLFVPNP